MKQKHLSRFFTFDIHQNIEYCYYVESKSPLGAREKKYLFALLGGALEFPIATVSRKNSKHTRVVEIGPRLQFESPWGSQAMQAISEIDPKSPIIRIEHSVRHVVDKSVTDVMFIASLLSYDGMMDMKYEKPLSTLDPLLHEREHVLIIPLIRLSEAEAMNVLLSFKINERDTKYWYGVFKNEIKRDPTSLELFSIAYGLTEHSKHPYMNRSYMIDGVLYPPLFTVLKEAYAKNKRNTVDAFNDNSSAIEGDMVVYLLPEDPSRASLYAVKVVKLHPLLKIETHNAPTAVSPDPGAATGVGGTLRDLFAKGKGSFAIASVMGIHVGALQYPDYVIPGELRGLPRPAAVAAARAILVQGTNGGCRYNNQHGIPMTMGKMSSFEQMFDGKRRAYIKPILLAGGIGAVVAEQSLKGKAETELVIVMIGGKAYKVGFGGGSFSSEVQGENNLERDFNAVQRDNALVANKTHRVVQSCIEIGIMQPGTQSIIVSIHDQGAAGPCNVLSEIIEEKGGMIDISKIKLGDPSMSLTEVWLAEYQERLAILLTKENLTLFQEVCEREEVNCEVLGVVTDTGNLTVVDSSLKNQKVIDIPLATFAPPKNDAPIITNSVLNHLLPISYLQTLLIDKALEMTYAQLAVSLKGWLMHKADRSVGGKVIMQQECGPVNLPIANAGMSRLAYGSKQGIVVAMGQQSNMIMIDPMSGARMTVAESLLKLFSSAHVESIEDVKACLNEMWAAKLPGQDARLYKAVTAAIEEFTALLMAIIGGKDSLSLAAEIEKVMVMSPDTLVATVYALVSDVNKKFTPDLKRSGSSRLGLLDFSCGEYELGGSPFAQATGNIGNKTPDIRDMKLFGRGLKLMNEANKNSLFLSLHKRVTDGLMVGLSEMAMAGRVGIDVAIPIDVDESIPYLFACEAGVVVEYLPEHEEAIEELCAKYAVPMLPLGITTKTNKIIVRNIHGQVVFESPIRKVQEYAERTGYYINRDQVGEKLADDDLMVALDRKVRPYHLTFLPKPTSIEILNRATKYKVAVLREEGSNGDRDAAYFLRQAGFDPYDVLMSDLAKEKITLEEFKGQFWVGGFSFGDVFGSGVVWATKIKHSSKLREMFREYFNRLDTFTLAICNGCQALPQLFPEIFDPIPFLGGKYPKPTHNISRKFESRHTRIKVVGESIFTTGMVGSELPIPSAHGEGQFRVSKKEYNMLANAGLVQFVYVDNDGNATEQYPDNPNGSSFGIAGMASLNKRMLWMMPHPERWNSPEQDPWPGGYMEKLESAPMLQLVQNARDWLLSHS